MDSYTLKIKIAGIPTVITSEHFESLNYWKDIQDADLLSISGHSGMSEGVEKDGKGLTPANFKCMAFNSGIVSSHYWFNPHSNWEKGRLMDMGSKRGENGRRKIYTILENGKIKWYEDNGQRMHRIYDSDKIGRSIFLPLMNLERKKFILDINLDAFSCLKKLGVENVPNDYDCEAGWEDRLWEAEQFLWGVLKKPDLITVTRSQGEDSPVRNLDTMMDASFINPFPKRVGTYVSPEIVEEIQIETLSFLEGIYKNDI